MLGSHGLVSLRLSLVSLFYSLKVPLYNIILVVYLCWEYWQRKSLHLLISRCSKSCYFKPYWLLYKRCRMNKLHRLFIWSLLIESIITSRTLFIILINRLVCYTDPQFNRCEASNIVLKSLEENAKERKKERKKKKSTSDKENLRHSWEHRSSWQ